ncbi:sure-like protein [Abortiporus biennis]|nr:sure-like protein [Abortiporus biennis]
MIALPFVLSLLAATLVNSQNIVLTNDDGWAVAQIRAQFDALTTAGFNVVLSAPAENQSGTGSSSATPKPLTQPCEFNTCPTGSPATGSNSSMPRFNYVNSFPVDAVRFGIQTLSPQFFGKSPDFVVSGPNVGNNLGSGITGSGTVGAACEAAIEGIPSVAFSGASTSQVSYTTLQSSPNSAATKAALLYSQLTVGFVEALIAPSARPILPSGITVNVNFPSTSLSGCTNIANYEFVFSRLTSDASATDVVTCNNGGHLPTENSVIAKSGSGSKCFVSVTVIDATTKKDVSATTQAAVLNRLGSFLSCLPN